MMAEVLLRESGAEFGHEVGKWSIVSIESTSEDLAEYTCKVSNK